MIVIGSGESQFIYHYGIFESNGKTRTCFMKI